MKLVKAWSGKWHIHEADLETQPAIPKRVLTCDGTTMTWPKEPGIMPRPQRTEPCGRLRMKAQFERIDPDCWVCNNGGKVVLHPLPQPERRRALTVCGEEILLRDFFDTECDHRALDVRNICSKCPIRRRLGLR